MTRRTLFLTLAVGVLVSGSLYGQTKPSSGDALIDKALNKFDYATRITATVEIALPAQPGAAIDESRGITLVAKVINDGKGKMAKSRFEFNSPTQGEWVLLDDGKRLYTLNPLTKEFVSAARKSEKFSSLFRPTIERMRARGVTFTAASGEVEGKPVYVMSANSVDGFTAQVVVDKATMILQSIVVATPTRRIVNQYVVKDVRLDSSIAASEFQRPADYKPYKPDAPDKKEP